MTITTDPSAALSLFQDSLGRLSLQPGATDPTLNLFLDQPQGRTRMSFVTLEGRTVTTLIMFIAAQTDTDLPGFHLFYAVPPAYRNQARAQRTLASAIRELTHGCALARIDAFSVEAIVAADNPAAQAVAAHVFARSPVPIADPVTGQPALAYGQIFGGGAAARAQRLTGSNAIV